MQIKEVAYEYKKVAYIGLLTALAFILSYVEFLLPVNMGIYGAKLGLPNLVVVAMLYTLKEKETFALSMVRILLVGFTFGNLSGMLYSFAGGILSFAVMAAAKRTQLLSVTGVSVLGGVFHNIGQILLAMAVLETKSLISYLPALLLAGCVSGTVIGILGAAVTKRIQGVYKDRQAG